MTPKEFVKLFFDEKEDLIKYYFGGKKETEVSIKIAELNLEKEQLELLKSIINSVITDTMYTILLALDGCASIGGVQEMYKLYDEQGNLLTDAQGLDEVAWKLFHGNDNRH